MDMKDANNPYFVRFAEFILFINAHFPIIKLYIPFLNIQVPKEPDPRYALDMAKIEVVQSDVTDGQIHVVDDSNTTITPRVNYYSCCGS